MQAVNVLKVHRKRLGTEFSPGGGEAILWKSRRVCFDAVPFSYLYSLMSSTPQGSVFQGKRGEREQLSARCHAW